MHARDHARDHPRDRAHVTAQIVYTLEMVAKIIVQGLINHKGAYLRSGWNVLDCGIVLSCLVSGHHTRARASHVALVGQTICQAHRGYLQYS